MWNDANGGLTEGATERLFRLERRSTGSALVVGIVTSFVLSSTPSLLQFQISFN